MLLKDKVILSKLQNTTNYGTQQNIKTDCCN